jgi:hypothetical protein
LQTVPYRVINKITVGWTNQSFETYLAWLQRRIPWHIKVLATRQGTIEGEKDFHREHKEYRADYGGNEWYPLDMLDAAQEFFAGPEAVIEALGKSSRTA